MPTYFVMYPAANIVAEVQNARNTKHARTTLLDYLSRKGKIPWTSRQDVRKSLKVVRGEPGEMESNLLLDYHVGEQLESTPIPPGGLGQAQAESPTVSMEQVHPHPEVGGSPLTVLPSRGSPIAQVSRQSGMLRRYR